MVAQGAVVLGVVAQGAVMSRVCADPGVAYDLREDSLEVLLGGKINQAEKGALRIGIAPGEHPSEDLGAVP